MGLLSVEVDPEYSSKVAIAKFGKSFRGFNRHQLAAFVIARRALGFREKPVLGCLPMTRKEKTMWNRCARYYGHRQVRTLLRREPTEWKNVGDANGGRVMTELLTARPANASSTMGLRRSSSEGVTSVRTIMKRAERVRPNGHASRGDGARGDRVYPPDAEEHRSAVIFDVKEDGGVR